MIVSKIYHPTPPFLYKKNVSQFVNTYYYFYIIAGQKLIESKTTLKLIRKEDILNGKRKYYFYFFIQDAYYNVYNEALKDL